MESLNLKKGHWMRYAHQRLGGYSWFDQTFRFTSPRWVFGSDGPLAAWCAQFPDGADASDRDVYQFGVYTGGSLAGIVLYLRDLNVRFGSVWGFDSFVGLPPEEGGAKITSKNWRPGAYSAADALRAWNWSAVEATLHKTINRSTVDGPVAFVRGFFNESLTPTLARQRHMRPALFVDIDADLYISAAQALDWLFCSGLMVAGAENGTLVRYDDWGGPMRVGELLGEARAHREITIRHHVYWSQPALLPNWFRVLASTPDRGHCARAGYPVPRRQPVETGGGERADGVAKRWRACVARVDMFKRPFVSRKGLRSRCSPKYHRHQCKTLQWTRTPRIAIPPAPATAEDLHVDAQTLAECPGCPRAWQRPEFCAALEPAVPTK